MTREYVIFGHILCINDPPHILATNQWGSMIRQKQIIYINTSLLLGFRKWSVNESCEVFTRCCCKVLQNTNQWCTDLFMCDSVHIRRYNGKFHWKVQGCNSTPEERLESLKSGDVRTLEIHLCQKSGVSWFEEQNSLLRVCGLAQGWPISLNVVGTLKGVGPDFRSQ